MSEKLPREKPEESEWLLKLHWVHQQDKTPLPPVFCFSSFKWPESLAFWPPVQLNITPEKGYVTIQLLHKCWSCQGTRMTTAVTVLFMMVSGGSAGGFLLKSTIITILSVQDPCISFWFVQMLKDEVQSHIDGIIHRPVWSISKLQGV